MRSGADFFQKHYTISRVVSCKVSARKLLFSWRYREKNSKTSKHWWFWLSKIMIFHENLNFPKIISPQPEEIWRWFFPGTLYYNTSWYQESFSSKALLFMEIESKNLQKMMIFDSFSNLKNDDFDEFQKIVSWNPKCGIPKKISKVVY